MEDLAPGGRKGGPGPGQSLAQPSFLAGLPDHSREVAEPGPRDEGGRSPGLGRMGGEIISEEGRARFPGLEAEPGKTGPGGTARRSPDTSPQGFSPSRVRTTMSFFARVRPGRSSRRRRRSATASRGVPMLIREADQVGKDAVPEEDRRSTPARYGRYKSPGEFAGTAEASPQDVLVRDDEADARRRGGAGRPGG